jgi:hypothetical protein
MSYYIVPRISLRNLPTIFAAGLAGAWSPTSTAFCTIR